MAVLAPPVQVVASGAPPFVAVSGNAPPFVAVSGNAPPITIVASGAPPITLLNEDGSLWTGGGGGVAPVLSVASAVDFSDVFVWGQTTTDTASGTLYAVVVASAATTPSAAQIVAGTDAAGAAAPNASVAITSTGVKQVLVRGLTAVTACKVCMAHQLAGQNSNVVTGSFTTDTLVQAFATDGTATNITASTGSAALGLNQADPHGGTNALRWTDNADATTGSVDLLINVAAFFNGVNKFHMTVKHQGGAAWLRHSLTSITANPGNSYWNTSTGAIGTINWTPTPVTFSVVSGWFMWSGSANCAGADLTGVFRIIKAMADNTSANVVRNGTNIHDIYNIRVTRV